MISEFTDNLKTEISEIDNQHEELIKSVNNIYENYINGVAKEKIEELFCSFGVQLTNHFETEESYMEKFHYQEILLHKSEHFKLKQVFEKVKIQISEDDYTPGYINAIYKLMLDWFVCHILDFDKQLAAFLKATQSN